MNLMSVVVRRALHICLITGAVVTVAPSAQANHGTAPQGWPDNSNQYVDRHSLGPDAEISVARGIAQLNRSVLKVTLTGSGDIDVYDGNYGDTGWDGQTRCTDKVASTWLWQHHCDVFTIKFNTYATASYSTFKSQVIGCHEFGHTAGLDHRAASNDSSQISCMRGSGYLSTVLDQHDLDVINDHF
ncbi:MAG: hypothetical protein ACJ72D_28985 [Marmoricola sp.]